jgi:hypothetical protein
MEDNSKQYHLVPEISGNGTSTNLMGYNDNELKRVNFSYLHGDLQEKANYDIFSFYGDIPTEEGIYKGFVEFPDVKIECTIFLWKCNEVKGLQGLVVANNDKESFEDAKTKYEKKEYFI